MRHYPDEKLNPLERLKPFAAIFFTRLAYSFRLLFKLKIYITKISSEQKTAHFDMHHSNEKMSALRYKYLLINNVYHKMEHYNK